MTDNKVKTRFAPSPTGYLHLGNARTALFSVLLARKNHGIFLLRIEDTDQERSDDKYVQALEEDLYWLGFDWQEGPSVGGDYAPYHQIQRIAIYEKYYKDLEQKKLAYPCFCSEQQLKMSRKAQLASGKPPRYSGICAHLTSEQVQERLEQGLRPTLRFRVPPGKIIKFNDLVRGEQSFNSDDIGDFIIRRADGTPAFFFTNAIDDSLMGVTHVLRGEAHLANTPRQMMLHEAMGLHSPMYGHISLIVGNDGSPLSKRHGSRSVRELRKEGYFPDAVVNFLARLGHYYERNEFMDLDKLSVDFEITRLGRAPARYDPEQLQYWQREAVAHAEKEVFWQWLGAEVHELVDKNQIDAFIQTIRPNVTLPIDALYWARVVYTDNLQLNEDARQVLIQAGSDFFKQALAAVDKHYPDFHALANEVKTSTGTKGKHLFQPLRVALTGELHGPEMTSLLPLLPIDRVKNRLQAWVSDAS